MGCDLLFDESNADLTQMMQGIKKGDMYVSRVIHKAFLEVRAHNARQA